MVDALLSSLAEVTLLLYAARHIDEDLRYAPPHSRHRFCLTVLVAAGAAMVLSWVARPRVLPVWPHWRELDPTTLEPVAHGPGVLWPVLGQAALSFYAIGVVALSLQWLASHLRLWCVTARVHPVTAGGWRARLDALDPTRRVRLCVGSGFHSPLTWGLFTPVIVLPERALDWPRPQCEWTLRHELAHIRRRDWFGQQVGYLACILCWPVPAVWRLYGDLQLEAERAADDAVLVAGARAVDYGEWLLRESAAPATAATVAIHGETDLAVRLRHLLNPYGARSPSTSGTLTAVLLGLVVAQPLVHLRLGRLAIDPLILTVPREAVAQPAVERAPRPSLKLVRELTVVAERSSVPRPSRPPDALHQPIPPPLTALRRD